MTDLKINLPSLYIGLVVGVILLLFIRWFWPHLTRMGQKALVSLKARGELVRSGTEANYRSHLYAYVQKHHLGAYRGSLDQLFITTRLLIPESIAEQSNNQPLDNHRLHYLWPDLAATIGLPPPPSVTGRQLLTRGNRILLASEPGSGKSTYLADCAALYAHGATEGADNFLAAKLPVFIHVAELEPNEIIEQDHEPADQPDPVLALALSLSRRTGALKARKLENLLREKCQAGQLALLLDGLDELSADQLPLYANWLGRLLLDYPEIQVIAAGPQKGYGPLLKYGFAISGLLAWRQGQAEQLAKLWESSSNGESEIPLPLFWRPGQLTLRTCLRLELAESNDPRGIPERGYLRDVELMEAAVQQVLRRTRPDGEGDWLVPATRDLWQAIAYRIVHERTLSLTMSEVSTLIGPILLACEAPSESRSANKLTRSIEQSGLFIAYGNDSIGFFSPLWRDYLAASYLAQNHKGDEVIEHLNDDYWSKVVRFFIGRVGALPFVRSFSKEDLSPYGEEILMFADWLPETLDRAQWRRQVLISLGRMVVDQKMPVIWRQRVMAALAKTDEDGVATLLNQLLSQKDPILRQTALACLARVAPTEAVSVAARMSSDSNPIVREAAVHILAWMADPAAETPLLHALLEPDEPTSRAAAEGIALNDTADSRQIFEEALVDDSLSVRRAAVNGLALLDDDWAKELLSEVAHADNQRLVQAAAGVAVRSWQEADGRSKWQTAQAGEQEWFINWSITNGQVAPVGSAAIPIILSALESDEGYIRASAAITLGQLAIQEALPSLRKALSDPQAEVRSAAFTALCHLERAWLVPVMVN